MKYHHGGFKMDNLKKIKNSCDFNGSMLGMILFDGSMPNEKSLYLRHGGKQLSYIDEKIEFIKDYLQPTSVKTSIDKNGYSYRYAYFNNNKLKYFYKDIYKNGKKTLSQSILNRFNDFTLAFMYMDDGSLVLHKDPKRLGEYHSREIYLAVNSFNFNEVENLQKLLNRKWDINFRIGKDKGKYRLCCNGENAIKFCTIIAPIVKNFPTLFYKLDFKYKNKKLPF